MVNDLLAQLIHLKIRLHNSGSDDPQKWNLAGIGEELERIFGKRPDFLGSDPDWTAEEWEKRLSEWAVDHYTQTMDTRKESARLSLFPALSQDEFMQIFLIGLMNQYLRISAAPVSWLADEFVQALEKIFLQMPPVSAKEIRDIRREKLEEILGEWIRSMDLGNPDDQVRHRVLGNMSILFFVGASVEYSFRRFNVPVDHQVHELSPEQKEFLHRLFGSVYEELHGQISRQRPTECHCCAPAGSALAPRAYSNAARA